MHLISRDPIIGPSMTTGCLSAKLGYKILGFIYIFLLFSKQLHHSWNDQGLKCAFKRRIYSTTTKIPIIIQLKAGLSFKKTCNAELLFLISRNPGRFLCLTISMYCKNLKRKRNLRKHNIMLYFYWY